MKKLSILLTLLASPAMAASGPFFSLHNTNFVVLIAFIAFIGILIYAKVPAKLTGMLDARAATIKAELDEARALRESNYDYGAYSSNMTFGTNWTRATDTSPAAPIGSIPRAPAARRSANASGYP